MKLHKVGPRTHKQGGIKVMLPCGTDGPERTAGAKFAESLLRGMIVNELESPSPSTENAIIFLGANIMTKNSRRSSSDD
jgi:hypothetical protein